MSMAQGANEKPRKMTHDVPLRTMLAAIGLVVATYLLWQFIQNTWPILQLILIATFFALALNPAVDWLQHRLRMRRGLATAIVFVLGVAAVSGLAYLFIKPIVEQTQVFVESFPKIFQDATNGRGFIGRTVDRYDLDTYVVENQSKLQDALTSSTSSVISIAGLVFSTVVSLLTVLVLSFMMLLEGPKMLRVPLVLFRPSTAERIRSVAADASKAVTGYTVGQLVMSTIAGTVTYIAMLILDVPYALVLAVWVGFCAIIPLVGATIGAIGSVSVSFLHSTKAGIIAFIVYVVYQQLENNFLQPNIMARTVRLNPLTVLVSVLLGVQLAGALGAVLAIPVAGAIQVIGRDVYDSNRGRFGGEPTIGADKVPLAQAEAAQTAKEHDAN